jgi:hypothetical protein
MTEFTSQVDMILEDNYLLDLCNEINSEIELSSRQDESTRHDKSELSTRYTNSELSIGHNDSSRHFDSKLHTRHIQTLDSSNTEYIFDVLTTSITEETLDMIDQYITEESLEMLIMCNSMNILNSMNISITEDILDTLITLIKCNCINMSKSINICEDLSVNKSNSDTSRDILSNCDIPELDSNSGIYFNNPSDLDSRYNNRDINLSELDSLSLVALSLYTYMIGVDVDYRLETSKHVYRLGIG